MDVINYRPISLISNISKLIEKAVDGGLFLRKRNFYLKDSLDLGTTDQQQIHLLIYQKE